VIERCCPACGMSLTFSEADSQTLLCSLCGSPLQVDNLVTTGAQASAPATADPYATRGDRAAGEEAVTAEVMACRDTPDLEGYEILGELGRGGMGVVYKARQKGLKRLVALKMILSGAYAGKQELARFRAEAEAVATVHHENIVQIYEIGEQAGRPFFSLEYVDGGTLARRISGTALPNAEAARILVALARAVQVAHEAGVIHRDLKPANVLLTRDGVPKVTDFGLVKRLDGETIQTVSGEVMGTPSYMAPEQAAGRVREIGPATDVYALGAILYELLTGRPPFRAATAAETVLQVLHEEPVQPRLLNRGIDTDLELIVLKCLDKAPDRRYPSAAALAADLEAFLRGEPITARSARLSSLMGRFLRSTPQAVVLEQWGLLWMCHSGAILALCTITNLLQWQGVQNRLAYFCLWTVGLGVWAQMFWTLRRHGGPVTTVERQVAHAWAADVIFIALTLVLEMILGLPVLTLAPLMAVAGGSVFLTKASILSGTFYCQAAMLYVTAIVMAIWPQFGMALLGVVTALCFFVPGLHYYRQAKQAVRAGNDSSR
jgi:tRNA A-37 threonylcarbamoyl transferase component Bud32